MTVVRTLLRPRWIAGHLLVLVTVVTFVNLGLWQLRRHAEVRDLRDAVAEAQALEIVSVQGAEPYRRVFLAGEYDAAAQVRILRSEGGQSGHRLLTPMVLFDGTAILVDRGWVPLNDVAVSADDQRSARPPLGVVRTEGYLWPAERGSWLPSTLDTDQVVRRIDPAVVQPFVPYPMRDGYVIESLGWVVPPPTIPSRPHLSYAVQWFLFTLVVLVGYPLLLRRAARRG